MTLRRYHVSLHFFFCFVADIDANDQDSGIEAEDGEAVDNSRKIGYYNATENSTAPKFIKLENMHKMVVKPAGNMMKLKCAAEGKFQADVIILLSLQVQQYTVNVYNKYYCRIICYRVIHSG